MPNVKIVIASLYPIQSYISDPDPYSSAINVGKSKTGSGELGSLSQRRIAEESRGHVNDGRKNQIFNDEYS